MGFALASLNVFPKVDFQRWISQKCISKSGFYSRYAFGSTFFKGGFYKGGFYSRYAFCSLFVKAI